MSKSNICKRKVRRHLDVHVGNATTSSTGSVVCYWIRGLFRESLQVFLLIFLEQSVCAIANKRDHAALSKGWSSSPTTALSQTLLSKRFWREACASSTWRPLVWRIQGVIRLWVSENESKRHFSFMVLK